MPSKSSTAPWTDKQVENINQYQTCDYVHPFTCGTENCREPLTATIDGFICSKCDYTQNWCHDFMVNWDAAQKEMLKIIF